MKFIKKTFRVIYNFKEMKDVYPHATTWKMIKWFLGRVVRNTSIIASFALTSYVSAITWNKMHPVTVYAEKTITVTVKDADKFENYPLLMRICKAESGNRQFKANGDVVRGIVNPSDIGFCQINEYINNDLARKMGFDIYTEKGNKDFAVYLFKTRGAQPWESSRKSLSNPNGWSL